MWWKKRIYLFITIGFLSDFIRIVISLTGDHICPEQERYVAAVRKPFKKPVRVREYKWCLQIPPRCEEDKIVYVDDYKTEEEERIRIIEKCCSGYRPRNEICVPISCAHCIHATCNETIGKCLCDDGYIGENCDKRCSFGKWGPECALSCDCRNSSCQHTNGTCICSPGWIGQRCDIQCPNGYYGENCNHKCTECVLSCDSISGQCINENHKHLEQVSDSLKDSSTFINSFKHIDNSATKTLPADNSSSENSTTQFQFTGNYLKISDGYPNLSTENPSSTQFQNLRKYAVPKSEVYTPRYIKIIPPSHRQNKSSNQEFDINQSNSSIVYIKTPKPRIKQTIAIKTEDERFPTFPQRTTIDFIDIIDTTDQYLPTSSEENNLETITESLPIYEIISPNLNQNFDSKKTTTGIEYQIKNQIMLSHNENDTIFSSPNREELNIEEKAKSIFENNDKYNMEDEIDNKEMLLRMQPLHRTTEPATNSIPTQISEIMESQRYFIDPNSQPNYDIIRENIIQTTEILQERRSENEVILKMSDPPQIPQTTKTLPNENMSNPNYVYSSEIPPTEIQPEINQNNPDLTDILQTTEATVVTQIPVENQSNPPDTSLTTEFRSQITFDNPNNPSPTEIHQTTETLPKNMLDLIDFDIIKIPQNQFIPKTVVVNAANLNISDTTEIPQTTEILTKTTIENIKNLNNADSTNIPQTEMISTLLLTEPSTTITASYSTRENYVSDTSIITIRENQLQVEITTNPYFDIHTNHSRFLFTDDTTNIRDQDVSDVPEQDRQPTYSEYYEDITDITETSDMELTTVTHIESSPITTSTRTNLISKDYVSTDTFINTENEIIQELKSTPSNQELKTTPWYRATFMKPEVQIPINTNESILIIPTSQGVTLDHNKYNPNGINMKNNTSTIPNKTSTKDVSINNMEMTLNNGSIKIFITNSNLDGQKLSNSSEEDEEDLTTWTPLSTTDKPKLSNSFAEDDSTLWSPNKNLSNLSEEEQEDSIIWTPNKYFTTDSTQSDTIETKHNQQPSSIIQTSTNPTITQTTVVVPSLNTTHLNISQTNSTVSDIIKMLTSKTYLNQYQLSTKIPLNNTSTNPVQNFTIKLTPITLESSTIKIEPVIYPTNLTSHINQKQASPHDDITSFSEKLNLPINTYPSINNTYNYYIYQRNHPNSNQTLDELLNPLKELLLNSKSTTPIIQTSNNHSINNTSNADSMPITFNFSEIPSTVETIFPVLVTTDNNSYETSTSMNENNKPNSEIFISKNISIKIFSTPEPENNRNISNEWPNKNYHINQKDLDDSDIIPILREILPKIETSTISYFDEETTIIYSNQTDVFDYETYEEVTTNKSIQTTENVAIVIKEDKSMKLNLSDVIMKIYNDDDVIKDLERNSDLLRRVHDAIIKDSMNNNQTFLINQSNTQTIYHTVMITLLGIAIGIFLAIIIASIILYMTDTSRKVAKHTRTRLQSTAMGKKDYAPTSVHYIQRDDFMTPLQERITIFNPKFTAEPESTFGNLLANDCRDKVNRFITDTLRVVYDNTYDHPQSPPTNGQFVGSTFFASKSDQSAEHLYDEIPAWKQPKPIAHPQLPQYSETCEYVSKNDGPDIVTTKL